MRVRANVDTTQPSIVKALRAVGATVLHLHQLGSDAPDLLVGFRGRDYLLEVKGPKTPVTDAQSRWHEGWRGRRPHVVRSPEEALQAIGATR